MTQQEIKARKMIKKQSTGSLITQFELTELSNDPYIPTVRGWIMDELESRDAEAFDNWMDSEENSPRKFYKGA